jgi:hypothetical protein
MIRVKLNDAIQVNVNTDDPRVAAQEARSYFQQNFPQEFDGWRRTQLGLGSSITRGTSRAIDEFQGQLYSAAEGLGQSLNMPSLQQFGREGRIEQALQAEAAQPQALRTPILESQGPGDVGRAAAEIVTGSLPQTATGIGGALAGARAGARAGGVRGALLGGFLGASGAGYLPTAGANIQRQVEEEAKRQNITPAEVTQIPSPGAAFAAAIPQVALESAADIATLGAGRFLGRPVAEAAGSLGQRILRGAGVGAATEPLAEVPQTAIERYQAGLPISGPEANREYLEAGLGGAIAGGVLGGATRGAFGARPSPEIVTTPEAVPAPAPVPRGSVPATGAGVPPPAPESAAPEPTPEPQRYQPMSTPERPQAFASPQEVETFLAENPRFTPTVPVATPEAAVALVNAARVADWQNTVNTVRQQAIDDFLNKPEAVSEEGATSTPDRAMQASEVLTNLGEAQARGNLDLNSFTPTQVARSALTMRDLDPGKPSKSELKSISDELNALVDAGYLRKSETLIKRPRTDGRKRPAGRSTIQTYSIITEPVASAPIAPSEAQPETATQLEAETPITPVQPQDEAALWRGYSLNAGPQARSPFVAQARNIASIRQRPFTRPEFIDFAQQSSTAATPEARDQVYNDFINRRQAPAQAAAPAAQPTQAPAAAAATPAAAPSPTPNVSPETTVVGGPELKTGSQIKERIEKQYSDTITNPIYKYFASPIMTMGKVSPVFRPVAEALKRFYTRSQEGTTMLAEFLEPAARLSKDSRAKIALALQDARSRQQMPDRAAFTPEEYAAMESLLKGGQRAYDLLIESYVNKYFDPALATSPEERARLEAFQQQRGDKHLWDMTPDQLSAASPKGWQEMQTYSRMRDPFFFPQLSIGSHFVAAYERMPGGKEKLVRLYAYEPLNKAQKIRGFENPEARAINYLQQEFPDANRYRVMTRGIQFENDARANQVRLDGDFIAQYLQELSKVSGREGQQIIARMSKEIDKAQMSRLFRPNKDILRAVTPDNAAEYILDVLPKYYLSVAKIQARRYIQDDFARAVEPLTPNDRAYWDQLLDYATTPTEAFGTARALAFFTYLGFAVDTALINMSQVPFVTLPRLSRDGGTNGAKYLLSAMNTVLFNRNFGKILKGDLAFTDDFIQKVLNKDEAAALVKARQQGIFTPLYTNESRGQVTADSLRRFGVADKDASKYANNVNWLADIGGRLMQAAEEFNRLSTFLAAYRMAKAQPDVMSTANKVDNANYTNPYDYAANVVFDTQFITSKEDRALVQRFTPAAEVATQFMSFPLKMTEQYVRHAGMLIRGLAKQDPVLAKAGAVSLFMMLGPLIGAAGVWGLPFADSLRELMERLIKEIWGTPIDFKVEIEKMLDGNTFFGLSTSSIVNNGIPHASGYMSLQKRLGIDPLPAEELLSGSTLALFGPVGGLIEKPFQAYEYYKNGDYWGLAATLLPRAVGNVVKGAQFATDEEQWTRRGTRVVTPEVLQEIDKDSRVPASVRQAIGFPPPELFDIRERVARARDLNTQMQKQTEKANMELARILMRVYEARNRNDTAAAAEAANQYRERRNQILIEQDGKPLDQRIIINESTIRDRAVKDLQGRGSPEVLLRESRVQARPALIEELQRQGQVPRPN